MRATHPNEKFHNNPIGESNLSEHRTMIARRAVLRLASTTPRSMSTATPKTHKAKDVWAQIEATRPKDDHPHVRDVVLSVCFLVQVEFLM